MGSRCSSCCGGEDEERSGQDDEYRPRQQQERRPQQRLFLQVLLDLFLPLNIIRNVFDAIEFSLSQILCRRPDVNIKTLSIFLHLFDHALVLSTEQRRAPSRLEGRLDLVVGRAPLAIGVRHCRRRRAAAAVRAEGHHRQDGPRDAQRHTHSCR